MVIGTAKEFFDFGNGEMIPCKIIELTDSISKAKISDVDKRSNALEVSQKAEKNEKATPIKKDVNFSPSRREQNLAVPVSPVRSDIVTQVSDIVEKAKRSSPNEHTVAYTSSITTQRMA